MSGSSGTSQAGAPAAPVPSPAPVVLDCHCHLLNFDFIPDGFFRRRAPVREWVLRRKWCRLLAKGITWLIPGKKYDRLDETLLLLKRPIEGVADSLRAEMQEAGIAAAAPLMMDLASAQGDRPFWATPYDHQIQEISDLARSCPGRFFPFVMVDPHRSGALGLAKRALEEQGFLGVKLYPPLGYHPEPTNPANGEGVPKVLTDLYRYCEENGIPITSHCSRGGPYADDLLVRPEQRLPFTRPLAWDAVLENRRGLRVNLAHFGGDFLGEEGEESWFQEACGLMDRHPNLFADVSYHSEALYGGTAERYFRILRGLLEDGSPYRDRVLFGTDWLMTRHTWRQKDYLAPFLDEKNLPRPLFERLSFHNPRRFLFPHGLPDRLRRFYGPDAALPDWLR